MILPFERVKNGHGAVLAMESQHTGKDVWEASIHGSENLMKNRVWSGTTNTRFLTHASQHRKPFTEIQEVQAYIAIKIPNKCSWVT